MQGQTEGDIPQGDRQEQNLRFQGQYLDRETGLHYNTFRYYDADIGRFISPDPIGLEGGINLGSYSPNPIGWIDPLGLLCEGETAGYGSPKHRGDGLEAHEILRNKKVQEVGVGTGNVSKVIHLLRLILSITMPFMQKKIDYAGGWIGAK